MRLHHRVVVLPTLSLALIAIAGCAHRAEPVAPIAAIAPPAPVYAPMPAYAAPGMVIPATLADGSYPTPSDGVSNAGAVWHVRAALNVAALSCPGTLGIADAYNRMLTQRKIVFAAAQRDLAGEFRGLPAGTYDVAMTRLYNFYAQFPARSSFCAAAVQVLADLAAKPDTAIGQSAPAALVELDRPFTDFYRAYDAWRAHVPVASQASVALNAAVPVGPTPFRRIELGQTALVAP